MKEYKVILTDDHDETSHKSEEEAIKFAGSIIMKKSLLAITGVSVRSFKVRGNETHVFISGELFAKIYPCY